jgi:hypothetical protein
MPITYELRGDAIWFVAVGEVEYDSGFAILDRGINEAATRDRDARWHVVFDILGSHENRSADELRAIAEFVAKHDEVLSGHFVVIADDEFHYALARMFTAFCENLGMQADVVRDVPSAIEWLEATGGS